MERNPVEAWCSEKGNTLKLKEPLTSDRLQASEAGNVRHTHSF